MAQKSWYYAINNERMGPVDEADLAPLLANGTIGPQTLVWCEGMADWATAETTLPDALRNASNPSDGSVPPLTTPSSETIFNHPTAFQAAVKTCFDKYATFKGRARRPEYWYFALFTFAGSIILSIVDAVVFMSQNFSPLSSLFSLAMLVPSLAVGARRLHDIGRSGWWLLIALVPVIGFIVLIIFLVKKGDEEANEYGPA